MSAAADFRILLTADAGITALVGTRIYPQLLPQAPMFPAISYQVVSGFRETAMDGPAGVNRARLQFDCWASTYLQAEAVANAVRVAIDGFKGSIGSPARVLQSVFFAGERDLYEPDPPAFRRSADYLITYQEET